jgi:hypothetical protein
MTISSLLIHVFSQSESAPFCDILKLTFRYRPYLNHRFQIVVSSLRMVGNELCEEAAPRFTISLSGHKTVRKKKKPVDTLYRLIFMTGSQRESSHGRSRLVT